MTGYHHIVWKYILELPLKYYQEVARETKKEIPPTYKRLLELFPKRDEEQFILELIKWLNECDGEDMRFDLKNEQGLPDTS